MKKDFSSGPDYWDWLASLKLTDPHIVPDITSEDGRFQVDEVIKVYEEAISMLPSPVMFEKYIKFLIDIINPNGEENQNAGLLVVSDHTADYMSHPARVFRKAEASELISNGSI